MIHAHSPSISKLKTVKLILALIIVLSHFDVPILIDINYLPVGLFFFMSGYGLSISRTLGKDFSLIKSLKKVVIPFLIAEIVYSLFFYRIPTVNINSVMRLLLFVDIPLPYAWYVRAQIVCYVLWSLSLKSKSRYKKCCIILIGLIVYSAAIYFLGQSITFCKTIMCFLAGVVFADNEKKLHKALSSRIEPFVFSLMGFVCALVIAVLDSLKIIAFSNHTASKYIISNALTCVFCICFFVLLSCIHFPRLKNAYLLDKLKNMSYELYLVQGIGQCTFLKMYFCDIVLIPISNLYCAIACSVVLDILLAIGLHYLSARLQGKYE